MNFQNLLDYIPNNSASVSISGDDVTITSLSNKAYCEASRILAVPAGTDYLIVSYGGFTGTGFGCVRVWTSSDGTNFSSVKVMTTASGSYYAVSCAGITHIKVTLYCSYSSAASVGHYIKYSQLMVVKGSTVLSYKRAKIAKDDEARNDIQSLSLVVDGVRTDFTQISGYYITTAGVKTAIGTFNISAPISIPDNTFIRFKATGYLTNNAMISVCNSSGTEFDPVVISADSTERIYQYYVKKSCYITLCYRSNADATLYLCGENTIPYKLYENSEKTNILSAFTNITCIGDSLTYSAVVTDSSNHYRQAYVPYPMALQRKCGAATANVSHAGYSASDWWGAYNDQIVAKDNQLAIVYLGTNGGLTDTMSTDMVGDDYTQWSDTNTGDYGKIIAKLLSVGSKVVLVKCYYGGVIETTNSVIEKMAEKFNVAIIDNEHYTDIKYTSFPDGTGSNDIHYNDFGYSVFADQIIRRISLLEANMMKRIMPS